MDKKHIKTMFDELVKHFSFSNDITKHYSLIMQRKGVEVCVNYNELEDYEKPLARLYKSLAISKFVSKKTLLETITELFITHAGKVDLVLKELLATWTKVKVKTFTYYLGIKGAKYLQSESISLGNLSVMNFQNAQQEYLGAAEKQKGDRTIFDKVHQAHIFPNQYKDGILKIEIIAKDKERADELMLEQSLDFENIISFISANSDRRQIISFFNT
jgi:hypothetical protein